MKKESTEKMNEVIVQLKLKGFNKRSNECKESKLIKYCKGKGNLCATFNFTDEYISFGRADEPCDMEGLDVTNFKVDGLLKRMYIK